MKYRKLPIEIEAVQFVGTFEGKPVFEGDEMPEWLSAALAGATGYKGSAWVSGINLMIGTLEGNMHAVAGDWIVRGVQGELYPCKPDIFEQTYMVAGSTARRLMGRYYIDTEFNGHGGKLISLGLVPDAPRVPLYIINEQKMTPNAWVMDNVFASRVLLSGPVQPIRVKHADCFGEIIREYLGDDDAPVIIADSPVDIMRFCKAISTDPNGEWASADYPRMTFEVYNVECYPTDLPGAVQHNALWDAMALRHHLRNHPDSKRRRHEPTELIQA